MNDKLFIGVSFVQYACVCTYTAVHYNDAPCNKKLENVCANV